MESFLWCAVGAWLVAAAAGVDFMLLFCSPALGFDLDQSEDWSGMATTVRVITTNTAPDQDIKDIKGAVLL